MNVFYSWESEIPQQKNIIEQAIKKALKRLKKDDALDMDFDRDTKNVPGAVNIINTILQKIRNCSIFIADVSFVENCFVNQNVLFELGYAVKKLGESKIILVFNKDKGNIEQLPFDILQLRILRFSSQNREELERDIYKALKEIYEKCDFKTLYDDWDKHDIDALERILNDIPKHFDQQLELKLLQHRRFESGELDYLFKLQEKIADNKNYLIDPELRKLTENLKAAFLALTYEISCKFAPDLKNSEYLVLDRPTHKDKEYQEQYYNYLTIVLPKAIQSAVDSYNELCHKRTELFGI